MNWAAHMMASALMWELARIGKPRSYLKHWLQITWLEIPALRTAVQEYREGKIGHHEFIDKLEAFCENHNQR